MKPIKALTLILALSMLIAPILVVKPGFGAPAVNYEVQPIPLLALTDINASIWGLETPTSPSPVGQFFNVTIHLTGATVANVPLGVAGVEVHFNFSNILTYATPVGFNDMLGAAGGVLNGPILETITGGLYNATGGKSSSPYADAVSYDVAGAGTGGAWNAADGLVCTIRFIIIKQPSLLLAEPDFYAELLIVKDDLSDTAANAIPHGDIQGTLHIDAKGATYPPRPKIYITPPAFTGSPPLGTLFNYTVMIQGADGLGLDGFWDVAGYDVTVNWNSTLITLVAYSEGGFLHQGGAATFGFYNVFSDHIQAVFVKLADPVPSSGTDSLLQLQFAVNFVGTSFPALTCPITLTGTDLASWAHPERLFGPWFGQIVAVDLPWVITPVPPAADPWDHITANAMYTAPFINPGPAIDSYTQYPDPFGGQGPNQHSDSFAPQQLVCLYAKVTFGGDRVTNKLVVFEVHNALGDKVTILQNYTDMNGIATVCFRIPMTDMTPGFWDPAIFGWWHEIETVEVDQVTVNDTLDFQVGWLAQITNVAAVGAPYLKYSSVMNFTATLLTIHEQPIWVLVSVDSYDVMGYPIGENAFWAFVNATRATCPFTGNTTTTTGGIYVFPNLIQNIPTWARVGTAKVVGYALTDWPRNGGTPWGPQSPDTLFTIKLS
jgi:hypothetical protein